MSDGLKFTSLVESYLGLEKYYSQLPCYELDRLDKDDVEKNTKRVSIDQSGLFLSEQTINSTLNTQ